MRRRMARLMPHQTHAFVVGCSRSGTTALTQLLNRHPDVAIGYERFSFRAKANALSPELYRPERFRRFEDGDSHHKGYGDDPVRAPVLEKVAKAKVVGDKLPQLIGRLDQLSRFPAVRVIFILREPFSVASSFQRRADDTADAGPAARDCGVGIREFNSTLRDIESVIQSRPFPAHLVVYEELFGKQEAVDEMFDFLGVDPGRAGDTSDIFARAEELSTARASRDAHEVAMHADFKRYRFAVERARHPISNSLAQGADT